jgi:hypothetical protein
MGYEWAHNGSVQLAPGTTLQDVLNLFPCDDEEPHLPLTPEGEAELADGRVWISLKGGWLEYRADGDRSWLDEEVTTFLTAVADKVAAEGWIDYELEDHPVPYGPTELARAEARLREVDLSVRCAEGELAAAKAEIERLRAGQA